MVDRGGDQKELIREAMQSIAERRQGKSRLVYDKEMRTIVAVRRGESVRRGLNITAEDADMFWQ